MFNEVISSNPICALFGFTPETRSIQGKAFVVIAFTSLLASSGVNSGNARVWQHASRLLTHASTTAGKNTGFCRVSSVFGRVSTGWFLGLVWLRRTFALILAPALMLQSNGLQHSDHKIHSFKMAYNFSIQVTHTRMYMRLFVKKRPADPPASPWY